MLSRQLKELEQTIHSDPDDAHACPLWKALLAEFIGTFFLTFVSTAPIVIGHLTGQLQNVDKVAPAGMVVAALIYTVGAVSGAHFNPAVTLGFCLRRVFPWNHLPLYWTVQLLGAIAAGATTAAMFGNVAHAGANLPHHGAITCLLMEILFTFLLVTVILGTASNHKVVGPNAALAVGLTITLCGLVGGPISGASMNPARSFGPALVGDALPQVWIYIAGPIIGAAVAAWVTFMLQGPATADQFKDSAGARRQKTAARQTK